MERLAGRVSPEERGELGSIEALVLEELVEVIGLTVDVGEESGRCGGCGVFSSHEELHLGSPWAGDDGNCTGHLDHICYGDGGVNFNVFLLECKDLGGDVLETVVI